ncbi:MAG TPA: hypothetical protein ENK96_05995 [Desulfobulbaceae bacterium]|nr:hypothetical protein [Desulfobulbaceae bacterium]
MGIYFIAAGSSSKNRQKTLDHPHSREEISQFLSPDWRKLLKSHFDKKEGVYVWGANNRNIKDLAQIKTGEFVVDVKNKVVVQVLKYCFYIETNNTRLQEYLGWDKEKPLADRRPYHYVYFLKQPTPTRRTEKRFFQDAFNLASNPQWLIGQKYFDDTKIINALELTSCSTIEDFLGISKHSPPFSSAQVPHPPSTLTIIRRKKHLSPKIEVPNWLKGLIGKINALKNDPGHLERDHEDLVASFFEILGYERIHDIKFRRGNIDIRIEKDNQPLITIEVKADWALSPESHNALSQAYNYALETGTPFVIITNGDRYCIYDRRQGMSYEENLIADISLTSLTKGSLNKIESLSKSTIV